MSEPTTEAGRAFYDALAESRDPDWLLSILAIEAEARNSDAAEVERLRKALDKIANSFDEWSAGVAEAALAATAEGSER